MLSSGIPTREEYLRLESEPLYADLLDFSREFERKCQSGSTSTHRYSQKWVKDPFLQWSRRWEYVYVAQQMSNWLEARTGSLRVVDAGSGFTFFPFYLSQVNAGMKIECFDNDPIAGEAILEAANALGSGPTFHIEDLEGLSEKDETIDAVYSISVIEHTKNPRKVVDEINRALKPGGIFVCTFDVSFEVRSPMFTRRVQKLVDHIETVFDTSLDPRPISFESLPTDTTIVTTNWDSEAIRSGLPWRNAILVWFYDMIRGRFRTSLYRPMTFFCQTIIKKSG